ncbi:tautomerase family protein [Glycomyces albidus]|jgi:4-oxalocrotonate tautomerase|uniref:Tautomerase n=1 Tax=Glycomyces albidus TaxID=2656774 RepID=A0A6L5GAD4_9ACTN|nr:tautomerase family protein [Glycomyces albidus]MQM26568.1 tautomerase [Glycomyces albidus]
MPFITVTTWPSQSDEQAQALIEEITKATHAVTGAPLDKIAVVINEIPQSRWGEAGVMATNPEFPELSRKRA